MNVRVLRSRVVGFIAFFSLFPAFQNCGVGFRPMAPEERQAGDSPTGLSVTSGSLGTVAGMAQVGKGMVFRVDVDESLVRKYGRLMWDNVYSDGMSYCDQTTSFDQRITYLQCKEDGVVAIRLLSYGEDGDPQTVQTLTVVVGAPAI